MLDIFTLSEDVELTDSRLLKFIRQNDQKTATRYDKLWNAYNNDYPIYHAPENPEWLADNRASVNFARVIVDTFEGFFLGYPVKVESADETVDEYVKELDAYTDADDINAELSNIVSIFGRGYRIVFVDEMGDVGTAYVDPREGFGIYNQSIIPKMMYFVRTYFKYDENNKKIRCGSISDDVSVRYFHLEGNGIVWDEEFAHGFDGVPAIEFIQNRARRGIFEDVLPLIDFVNTTLSDKMNDIASLAQNIVKIIGPKFDTNALRNLRKYHILNIETRDAASAIAEYLTPPNGDSSQEHLLDRLERLIYTVAMICDITNDSFTAASGVAIRWKMFPMINLAASKWRKFEHGLKVYYKLVCSNPVCPLAEDDWTKLSFIHVLNFPANVTEEATVAGQLSGITSRETQLKMLSFVDDPEEEMKRIRKEEAEDMSVQAGVYATERIEVTNKADESKPPQTEEPKDQEDSGDAE